MISREVFTDRQRIAYYEAAAVRRPRQRKANFTEFYYVYLMGNKHRDFFKIGFTKNVSRRLKSITVPFPLHIYVAEPVALNRRCAVLMEETMHRIYSSNRLRGEWFSGINVDDFKTKLKINSHLHTRHVCHRAYDYCTSNPEHKKAYWLENL